MKKRFTLGLLIVSLVVALFSLCSCNKTTGKFYSLEESFENGFITVEQLHEIAEYHNDGKDCPIPLDDKISNAIKETAAADTRKVEKYFEVKSNEFKILRYYGNYNNCYVVIIGNPYFDHPEDVPDYWVDVCGVQFHITSYDSIEVWVQD